MSTDSANNTITDDNQKKIIKMTQTDPIGIRTLTLPTGEIKQYPGKDVNRFPQISCDERWALYNFIDRTTFNNNMKSSSLDICNMFNPDKIASLYEYERANFPLANNSSIFNLSFNSIYGTGYPKEGQKDDYFCNMKADNSGQCEGKKLDTEPYHSYYTPVDETGKPVTMDKPSSGGGDQGDQGNQGNKPPAGGTDNSLAIGLGVGIGILVLIIIIVIIIVWRRRS